ncbi:MAG: neutral/alkaline non-lysosomal ceramidase N-terminal domain-containing protein [Candidatus Poribacteria bacterium]
MRLIMTVSLVFSLFIMASYGVFASDLKAGAAKRIITPKMSVYMAGLAENRVSNGVHDDLYARCLLLGDENTMIGFVSLDIIGLTRWYVLKIKDDLKKAGINADNVIITCTHQHSGPDTLGIWGKSEMESGVNPEYMDFLCKQIFDAISEAYANIQPVVIKLSSIAVPEGVSENSREPKLIDRELSLMKVDSKSGNTIATLVNFTAHPETLWSDNHLLTADYVHYVYHDVDKKFGGITLFINGALGGMVSVDSKAHTFEEAERIGTTVAQKAIESVTMAETQKNTDIIIKKAELGIPMENDGFKQLMEIGVFKNYLYENGKIKTEVNYIKIGDAQIATFPGEVLPKLGFKVKGEMKSKYKFIFGVANDELGYILAEEDFNKELYRYEKSMSIGSKIGTMTTEALIYMMNY